MAFSNSSLATSSAVRSLSSCAPSWTSSPELNEMNSTTPETSSDRSAPLTARSEPIASIFGCHSPVPAVAAEMVCGGLLSAAMNFLIITALNAWNPKIPPNTTATATSMITMRLIIYFTPVAAGVLFAACTVSWPAMCPAKRRQRADGKRPPFGGGSFMPAGGSRESAPTSAGRRPANPGILSAARWHSCHCAEGMFPDVHTFTTPDREQH